MPGSDAVPSKRLLIVDDEPVIVQILKAVFEGEPYALQTSNSGAEARRIIEQDGCDLLITDKNLPDASGLDLVRLLKQRNPVAEAIIITGYASIDTAIAALELDAFDYILKPLNNVFDIRKKVKQALAKQDMTLENLRLLEHLKHKNAELELALEEAHQLQSELIQSEKLAGIGTLAAGVAHEISSPLFGIMGLAEAIQDETDLAVARSHASEIVDYCKSVKDIVVELSSYSRAASNEYLTTIELAKVIDDALRLVQRSSPVEGVNFHTDLAAGIYVHARTSEVQQVFVNLIRNATEAVVERFGPGLGGEVRIEAGAGEGHVWARVSDNGVGIPAEKVGMVFDPFYTTKPPGKGTGLGLNVVYRILTKYRGHIGVESTVGKGTSFSLRIPTQE